MKLIAEDLLDSIKLRSMAPISQQTFTPTNVLGLANEVLHLKLVPLIMSVRENFFLTRQLVPLTANLDHYSVPERAIGDALVDIFYQGTDGKRVKTITRTKVHDLSQGVDTGSEPMGLLLAGGEIIVSPIPSASQGRLELWHYQRPNELTATTNCAKITAVNSVGGTTTFTVDTDLTASLFVGTLIDFPRSSSPFFNKKQDVAITGITSTTIAVATTDVQNEVSTVLPAVNDYICQARKTNIPMCPEEAHPLLAQMTAQQLCLSLGHESKFEKLQIETKELASNFLKLISNRIEAEIEPILNRHGIMSAMRYTSALGSMTPGQ